jgi:hypothetical protein
VVNNDFQVYQHEIKAGLKDILLGPSHASIVYSVDIGINEKLSKVVKSASCDNKPGLFNFSSILVTTGKNKNDDVFLNEELVKSYQTCIDKPVNYEHDSTDIRGYIKSVQILDDDYKSVDLAALPDKIHLGVHSVLWTQWEDKEKEKSIGALIEEILNGKWKVSQECFFKGFDYALTDKQGQNYIIARNEDSSFLTSTLRIYGGTGEFEGYTVSRVLRNIIFNGQGLVKKPANPESVIFVETCPFAVAKSTNNVYDILERENTQARETQMADSNEVLVNELKGAKASLEAKVNELQDKLVKIETSQASAKLDELKAEIDSKDKEIKGLIDKVAGLETVKSELNVKFEEANKKAKEAEDKLATIAAEQVKVTRIGLLVEAGLDKEAATAKFEKFAKLDDEMFKEIVELTKSSVKPVAPKQDEPAKAAGKVLESAQASDISAVSGGENAKPEDKLEATRAALARWMNDSLEQARTKKHKKV